MLIHPSHPFPCILSETRLGSREYRGLDTIPGGVNTHPQLELEA